jgi:hypothetical protein
MKSVLVSRWTGVVEAHPNGGFVGYGDYMDLATENAALAAKVEELEAEVSKHYNRVASILFADGNEQWRAGNVQKWLADYVDERLRPSVTAPKRLVATPTLSTCN